MRLLPQEIPGFFRLNKGFSLLEVLVAVGILAFIGVSVMTAMDTNSRANRTLDEQVTATNLATSYFEAIRQLPYDDYIEHIDNEYAAAGDNITVPYQYTVDIVVDYSDDDYPADGTTWISSSNHTTEKLQRITIDISRTDGKPVFSTCTFRTDR